MQTVQIDHLCVLFLPFYHTLDLFYPALIFRSREQIRQNPLYTHSFRISGIISADRHLFTQMPQCFRSLVIFVPTHNAILNTGGYLYPPFTHCSLLPVIPDSLESAVIADHRCRASISAADQLAES